MYFKSSTVIWSSKSGSGFDERILMMYTTTSTGVNSKYAIKIIIARTEQNFSVEVECGSSRKSVIWMIEMTQKTKQSSLKNSIIPFQNMEFK